MLIGSAIILLPSETLQQAKSTAASILFASNIYFYANFDYFDASSDFNALLHTWSLSAEEQFYILFPPLLAFCYRRFPAAMKLLVAIILVATLILSQWRVTDDPSAAFYLVQYRAWELMISSRGRDVGDVGDAWLRCGHAVRLPSLLACTRSCRAHRAVHQLPADWNFRAGTCFLTSHDTFASYARETCLPLSSTKPNYLLLGDSHAAHLLPGLLAQRDINLLQATASRCRPIANPTGERRCTALMNFISDDFLPKHRMNTVIIAARWVDGDWPALRKQIETVRRHADHVIVFGPIAEYDRALQRVLAEALYRSDPAVLKEHRVAERARIDAQLARDVPGTGATYVSVYKALCPDGRCTLWTSDGIPIQSDYGHLTAEGAKVMIERIRRDQPFPLD